MRSIVLGGGCFWGREELFRERPGVNDTEVGYAGGRNENPTYNYHPGHAEALKITYDESTTTHANEVVSYGILGCKVDNRRARVFVSGWKDHVAMYPLPKNESIRKELEPYVRGKGTLWFGHDEPLPGAMIRRVVQELALG